MQREGVEEEDRAGDGREVVGKERQRKEKREKEREIKGSGQVERGKRKTCREKTVKPFFHKDRVGKECRGARKRATKRSVNERTTKTNNKENKKSGTDQTACGVSLKPPAAIYTRLQMPPEK